MAEGYGEEKYKYKCLSTRGVDLFLPPTRGALSYPFLGRRLGPRRRALSSYSYISSKAS